jgi:protease II
MPIIFNRRQNQQNNLYLPSWSHRSTTKIGVPTPSHKVPTTTRQFIPTRRIKFQQTAVFTWGTIVGHDLAASEVTVLVATQRGPQ